jgi:hypothetical protein
MQGIEILAEAEHCNIGGKTKENRKVQREE